MKNLKKWANSPFVIMPLLVLFSVFDLILLGKSFQLSKSDWAGWVQAVGSIGAIVMGWAVVRHQIANGQRNRLEENASADRVHLEIGLRLAKDVYGIHMDVHRKHVMNQTLFPGRNRPLSNERIVEMQVSLHNFTLRPISPLLYAEVLSLLRELAYTAVSIREQNALPNTSNQRVKRSLKRTKTVLKCRDRIAAMLSAS